VGLLLFLTTPTIVRSMLLWWVCISLAIDLFQSIAAGSLVVLSTTCVVVFPSATFVVTALVCATTVVVVVLVIDVSTSCLSLGVLCQRHNLYLHGVCRSRLFV
jgi:hypothetical protein